MQQIVKHKKIEKLLIQINEDNVTLGHLNCAGCQVILSFSLLSHEKVDENKPATIMCVCKCVFVKACVCQLVVK